jgi:CBS domain-containing protein
MRVEELIGVKGSAVITVVGAVRLREAARIMRQLTVGALVVVTPGGQLEGVISEREIVGALALHGEAAPHLRVSDLMLPDRPTVAPTDTVRDAMTIMTERRVRHLPVVSEGSVVGLVSIGDTVKARLTEKITENLVLQDIARWPVPRVA